LSQSDGRRLILVVIPKAMAYAAIVASLFKPAAAATPTGHPDREHPGGDG
jgi:hypothetical protein